jgi:mono/diheme cytochrome c family protein
MWIGAAALGVMVLGVALAGQVSGQPTDDRFADLRARALGMTVFVDHCASCHGRTGHGDGPRVKELTSRPSDLTKLAERNGWTFPAAEVARVIDGADRAHRAGEMPLWGTVFRTDQTPAGEAAAKARVDALTLYLEFIQTRRVRR